MKKVPLRLTVNGEQVEIYVPPNRTLLEVLREDLELSGTKESCGEGVCGACTVLCGGNPVRSCLTLALEVQGEEVITIEGLKGSGGQIDTLQQSFVDHGAVQCGFCTPGMIMVAKAFLDGNKEPSEKAVREAISGNICRCTGYAKIVAAIQDAAGKK